MKKMITVLLTLCMVTVVIPPVSGDSNGENGGISPHEYIYVYDNN